MGENTDKIKAEVELEFRPADFRLLICTPSYESSYTGEYVSSLLHTMAELQSIGVRTCWAAIHGQIVHKARDFLAWHFLNETDATHLLLVDDDMAWKAEDVIRMLAHDKQCSAGVGRKRKDVEEYACMLADPRGAPDAWEQDPHNGLVSVFGVGTGFMLLSRKLVEEVSLYRCGHMYTEFFDNRSVTLPHIFPMEISDGKFWSEDYGFCHLVRKLGGKIWLDPLIELGHIGRKNFKGTPLNIFTETSNGRSE